MASPERLIPAFESHPASNGASVISRRTENLSLPVEATNAFRGSSDGVKVQNVSLLPDIVVAGGSWYIGEGLNFIEDTAKGAWYYKAFIGATVAGAWALGQAKKFGRFARRKWDEFTSPYSDY